MRKHARELGLLAVLSVVALVLALAAPGFYAPGNLRNLALDNLPLLLAATGMTLVILAGEIDVSIGAQFAAAAVLAGVLAKLGLPMPLVLLLVLALGVLVGACQGVLVARGVPAIVVTLAALAVLRGVLRWSTGGRWIRDLPAGFQWFGLGQSGGQILFASATLVLVLATAFVLRWLHLGRAVYAVGCDAAVARLAGIRTTRVTTAVFAAMSGFAAAAAVLSAARYPAIEIEAGAGLELQAIACVVLGGASIRGGRGTLLGTALGVILLGTLGTALVFLGVGAAWERAVQGGILFAAVVPEVWRSWDRHAPAWHPDAGLEPGGQRHALAAVLVVEIAAFALLSARFATPANAFEVVRATAELGLIALAALVVLKSGGIDLSVGAMMGLAAVTLGASHAAGAPIGVCVLFALAVGAVGGALNGTLVAAGVPPFLTTLATLALFRGLAEGWTGGYASYSRFPEGFLALGQGYLLGFLPPQAVLLGAVAVLAWLALHRAPFGRALEAVGFAPGAARHAGIPVARLQVGVYALSGLAAALAGVLYVAHVGQAKADAGSSWELAAITVAVLGGTSIRGGAGRVEGTVLALLCVGVLQNGLLVTGSPSELAAVLLGVMLVGTVALREGARALAAPASAAASSALRMRNSQLAVLVVAILAGALIIAASNAWLVKRLASGGEDVRVATRAPARVQVALLPKNKSDPYFASCREGAEEAARELGLELLWEGPNDTDAARQNEIIEAWITRGVDVIAASVENAASISTVLRKARAKGIEVLTWDADADADARDFFVNQATAEGIGHGLADEAGRLLGGQGSLAIVTATLTAANQNAWIEHIRSRLAEKWPGLSIAVVRPSDGLRDKALSETKAILRAHPEVKLLVVIAAAAVPGAAEAVKQESSEAKVIGLSVPSLCRDYVHEGVIASILLWNTVDLGYLTVHAAGALASGALSAGSTTFDAGRLGTLEVRGDNVLLGEPFRFDASNIDRFDF